jgi:hypothetical protein
MRPNPCTMPLDFRGPCFGSLSQACHKLGSDWKTPIFCGWEVRKPPSAPQVARDKIRRALGAAAAPSDPHAQGDASHGCQSLRRCLVLVHLRHRERFFPRNMPRGARATLQGGSARKGELKTCFVFKTLWFGVYSSPFRTEPPCAHGPWLGDAQLALMRVEALERTVAAQVGVRGSAARGRRSRRRGAASLCGSAKIYGARAGRWRAATISRPNPRRRAGARPGRRLRRRAARRRG